MADFLWGPGLADEPLRLDVAVGLGDDASSEELDEAARLLRRELADAELGEVELAEGEPVPPGARAAEGVLVGALTLNLLPGALGALMAVIQDWTGRRRGRTLRLAYGAGEQRLELEYDPDKTDINQVMVLLLARASAVAETAQGAGTTAGVDVVGGDKVSHVSAGADAVGRDKITEIHVAAGSTLIINDPGLGAPRTAASQVGAPQAGAPGAGAPQPDALEPDGPPDPCGPLAAD
jgi:hypothetical protein